MELNKTKSILILLFSIFLTFSCKRDRYANEKATFELSLKSDSTFIFIYPNLVGFEAVENGIYISYSDSLILLSEVKTDSIYLINNSSSTEVEDSTIRKRKYSIVGDTIFVNDMRKVMGLDNRLIKKENTSDSAVHYIKYGL